MNSFRTLLLAALTSLLLAPISVQPALAQSDCLGNRAIQESVSRGEIRPLADVLAAAGIGRDASVLNVQVCSMNGAPHYVVNVLDSSGNAQNLVLPAGGSIG